MKVQFWKAEKRRAAYGEFTGEGGVWDKAGVGAAHKGHSFKCWEAQSIDERFRLVKASANDYASHDFSALETQSICERIAAFLFSSCAERS